MKKKKLLYSMIIILAIVLFVVAIIFLDNTKFLGPIMITVGIYLLFGAIVKLCKTNDKLKHTILCALDLLFWLP